MLDFSPIFPSIIRAKTQLFGVGEEMLPPFKTQPKCHHAYETVYRNRLPFPATSCLTHPRREALERRGLVLGISVFATALCTKWVLRNCYQIKSSSFLLTLLCPLSWENANWCHPRGEHLLKFCILGASLNSRPCPRGCPRFL